MQNKQTMTKYRKVNSRGFSLLEYCAGAAVLAAIVYAGVTAMGQGVDGLVRQVGKWAEDRTKQMK
jgi:hypothetical protein